MATSDELDALIEEGLQDPEVAAAFAEAEHRKEAHAYWEAAHAQGIILVPFGGSQNPPTSVLVAAISEELLNAVLVRAGKDPDNWADIWALGLGFFITTGAPGGGATRLEAYQSAMEAYESLGMAARNAAQLAKLTGCTVTEADE